MANSTTCLPEDFLSSPSPNPVVSHIDFAKEGLEEYEDLFAVVIDNVLTPSECEQFIAAAENHVDGKWERAMVNIGNGRQAMYEDTRKCGRIIWDSPEVVAKVWARVEPLVPEINRLVNWPDVTGSGPVKRREIWRLVRCNERMRILKYTSGEYFKRKCPSTFRYTLLRHAAHGDGMYETDDKMERSYFTLHLYLNDNDHQPPSEQLEGGATTFWGYDMKNRLDVQPRMGSVLIFQQRFLIHSGDDVVRGTKMTMRTDIMYSRVEDEEAPELSRNR